MTNKHRSLLLELSTLTGFMFVGLGLWIKIGVFVIKIVIFAGFCLWGLCIWVSGLCWLFVDSCWLFVQLVILIT